MSDFILIASREPTYQVPNPEIFRGWPSRASRRASFFRPLQHVSCCEACGPPYRAGQMKGGE